MEISQASNLPAQVHLINSKFLIKQNAPRKKLFWNKFHFITWVKSSLFHPRMAKLIFGFNRSRLGTLLFILLLLLILQLNVQKFQISTKLPTVILFFLAKRSGNFGNSTSRKSPRRIFFLCIFILKLIHKVYVYGFHSLSLLSLPGQVDCSLSPRSRTRDLCQNIVFQLLHNGSLVLT